jgi:hypothetical protein
LRLERAGVLGGAGGVFGGARGVGLLRQTHEFFRSAAIGFSLRKRRLVAITGGSRDFELLAQIVDGLTRGRNFALKISDRLTGGAKLAMSE